jgi:hypothetical protein
MNATTTIARDHSEVTTAARLDDAGLVGARFEAEVALARLDQAAGDVDAAESRILDAIAEARMAPTGARSLLFLVNALGETYAAAWRLDDAERCYREAYGLIRAARSPNAADRAKLFNNLAALTKARRELDGTAPVEITLVSAR